jgi:uncharacterized protein
MSRLTDLIDVSVWTGTWPFDLNGHVSITRLADRLLTSGVAEALVSPLSAVLAPDPMSANRALLEECATSSDVTVRFHPVPVINPALATWESDLAAIVERGDGAIPAVRLLPTWQGWGPDHVDATAALWEIRKHGLVPIIQTRMVDERAMPIAASPAEFDVKEMVTWLESVGEVPVMLAGLYRTELPAIGDLSNIAVDLAFVESGESLATALEALPRERVLLGSHAPLLEPLAAVAKLPLEGPHREAGLWVGVNSARSWFGMDV